jgi:hypothetical protein
MGTLGELREIAARAMRNSDAPANFREMSEAYKALCEAEVLEQKLAQAAVDQEQVKADAAFLLFLSGEGSMPLTEAWCSKLREIGDRLGGG